MRKYVANLKKIARSKGLTVIDVVNSKNKLHVIVQLTSGEVRKVFTSKTPSDYRSIKNYSSFCGRLNRGLAKPILAIQSHTL